MLCVCFLASVWIVKGGMRCTLVDCTIKSGCEWQVLLNFFCLIQFSSVQFSFNLIFSVSFFFFGVD